MAKKSMRVIREYTMITAATFVVAAAVYFFLIPSGVSVGSISGLAMLLGNVIPLPISVLTFILNAALLVVGFLFIGREFGVTRERIRQIESKTLAKLRHPSRSSKLKDYIES